MTRFPDEEPESWEQDWSDWADREDAICHAHCKRCGHEGHKPKECPNVTPDLLRGGS